MTTIAVNMRQNGETTQYQNSCCRILDNPGNIADFRGLGLHGCHPQGRPRGRSVDCRPSWSAVCSAQAGLPYGQPRRTQRRTASSCASVCGWLTCAGQSSGTGGKESALAQRPGRARGTLFLQAQIVRFNAWQQLTQAAQLGRNVRLSPLTPARGKPRRYARCLLPADCSSPNAGGHL